MLKYWRQCKLLAACPYSIRPGNSCPEGVFRGSSLGVPLQFDVPSSVWGLEMLSLIFVKSLLNDQTHSLVTPWKPRTGLYVGKVKGRECGGLAFVSVDVIAALSADFVRVLCFGWPLECRTWVQMASVPSHHSSTCLYGQTKWGAFLSWISFQCCLDNYLPSYLLVSSTR